MSLEDLIGPNKFIDALVESNPTGTDPRSEGDDHLRGIKNVLKNQFPNLDGAVTLTQDEINDFYDADSPGYTKDELVTQVQHMIGMIAFWHGTTAPDGWYECNGQSVNPLTDPQLAALMTSVPDLRGYFVRGYATDGLVDPDAAGAARTIGSIQDSKVGAHHHAQRAAVLGTTWPVNDDTGNPVDESSNSPGNEARPVNKNLMYIIKNDDIPPRLTP